MRILLLLIAAAMGLSHTASAQSKTKRTCRVVFPERPRESPKVAYLYDGRENHMVSLPSMNFSEVVTLPSGELTLLMTPSPVTDPENLPLNAPRLRIPEGVRDFYILVTPDPKNAILPLELKMVDTGGGKLKAGETLWFNTTEHRILAKLGESRMSVDPMSRKVSSDPMSASGYYRAEFAYQKEGEGELRRISEQQWWHDARSRHVGFIVGTGGLLPKIYFFRDFRLKDTGGSTSEPEASE